MANGILTLPDAFAFVRIPRIIATRPRQVCLERLNEKEDGPTYDGVII